MSRHCIYIGLAVTIGMLAVMILLVCAMVALGQETGPSATVLTDRLQATERTLTIVRERELDMTRLVALYATSIEQGQKDIAQLRSQLESQPPCPPQGEEKKP